MAEAGWKFVKPILLQALGYFFLVLGVLGMFLPILQGFLFLFIGLIILARHAPWAERLLDNIRSRHPRFDRMIGLAERKSHEWGERSEAAFRACWRKVAAWLRPWEPSPRPARKRCSCRPDP
jgi:uncharacterized protein